MVAVAGPRRVLGDQDDDDQREQRQSDYPQHHLVREGAARHLADQRARTWSNKAKNKGTRLLNVDVALWCGSTFLNTLEHPESSLRRPRPAGSSEAAFRVRSCLRLPQASVSLGQSAGWAALAGHTGLGFDIALTVEVALLLRQRALGRD